MNKQHLLLLKYKIEAMLLIIGELPLKEKAEAMENLLIEIYEELV